MSTTTYFRTFAGAGNMGVGTTTPTSNLQVVGNVYASNALATTNVVASGNVTATRFIGVGGFVPVSGGPTLGVTGNIYASNALSSPNLVTDGITSNATQTTLNYDTLFVPYFSATTLYGNIAGSNTASFLNVYSANALQTTNVYASNIADQTGTFGTTGQVLTKAAAGTLWATAGSGSQWTGTSPSPIYYLYSVGIGTSTVTYPLTVTTIAGASAAAPYSNLAYQSGGWYQAYEPSVASTLKIYTDGKIGCTEVDVFSDVRIKTAIVNTSPETNLECIKKLKVRDFKYKDPLEHGSKIYTGLVAQEVREVIDSAVNTHNGIVPDIFQTPKHIQGKLAQFENKIEGVSKGARVKVFDESSERMLTVERVDDFEMEFNEDLKGPKVFVYGQIVNDFHTVSYDRLFPILLSAFQSLVSKVESMTPTPSDECT